jgi:SAM-dependent methyltransferase
MPPAPPEALRSASARYGGLHPRFRWYAWIKYRFDPCYRALGALIGPDSFTVDLGTGLGMLPVLLGVLGRRRALGVEWDAEKVRGALHAARGFPHIRMVEADLHRFAIPPCDVITLIDVLHYYDADRQEKLLRRCRAALRPRGRLLIRDVDGSRQGGVRWTKFIEQWATRRGWNRGPAVAFRPIAELTTMLVALGFRVEGGEVASRLAPGNVLLVAELDPTAAAGTPAGPPG